MSESNEILIRIGEVKEHLKSIDGNIKDIKTEQVNQKKILVGNGNPEKGVVFRLVKVEDCIKGFKNEVENLKLVLLNQSVNTYFNWKTVMKFLGTKRGMLFLAVALVFTSGGTWALYKALAFLIKNNLMDFIGKAM